MGMKRVYELVTGNFSDNFGNYTLVTYTSREQGEHGGLIHACIIAPNGKKYEGTAHHVGSNGLEVAMSQAIYEMKVDGVKCDLEANRYMHTMVQVF